MESIRIPLAYRVRKNEEGVECFELFRMPLDKKAEKKPYDCIGRVENPREIFKHQHHYDKIETLIEMALQDAGKNSSILYSAYPMIDGKVMLGDDVVLRNFPAA